ncbi:hypothetical protein [Hymenobacter sp. CRA2]|uniref:hypothetical protein n=1 Tax=Hymenobacter sp. CRA2 TaxID=1955620 RepID=UPI00098FC485|nr:hypothetical protein [Hymenobacter sp. CRA2]OON65639.1 hypothetical protein B0919_23465 [Hymenobacter sp. CRA2]
MKKSLFLALAAATFTLASCGGDKQQNDTPEVNGMSSEQDDPGRPDGTSNDSSDTDPGSQTVPGTATPGGSTAGSGSATTSRPEPGEKSGNTIGEDETMRNGQVSTSGSQPGNTTGSNTTSANGAGTGATSGQ